MFFIEEVVSFHLTQVCGGSKQFTVAFPFDIEVATEVRKCYFLITIQRYYYHA